MRLNEKATFENCCQNIKHSELLAKWVIKAKESSVHIRMCEDCFQLAIGECEIESAETFEKYRRKSIVKMATIVLDQPQDVVWM